MSRHALTHHAYVNAQRPPVQVTTRGEIVTGTALAWCAALSAEVGGPVTPADLDTALARDPRRCRGRHRRPVVPGGPGALPAPGMDGGRRARLRPHR
jgi:hypothetical protein